MKIGVVVEGHSEYAALPKLRQQLCAETGASSIKVLHACYDPHARSGRVVRGCRSAITQLAARKYDLVIVLIDREARTKTASKIASELEAVFSSKGFGVTVAVVVKDRCFENWLLSDLTALRKMKSRFEVTAAMVRSIEPDRADRANALHLLKGAVKGDSYVKTDDARRILEKATIAHMARHSRSFRCFLARLGHPALQDGSCKSLAAA